MRIRLAQIADAPALAHVLVNTGRVAHRGQMPDELLLAQPLAEALAESERNWARTLREIAEAAAPQECIYVAEEDADSDHGQVVGLAMGGPARENTPAHPHMGEVYVLYISPDSQGRGLGRHLVQAVSAQLAQLGMTALEIGCLAANAPARAFYEALGGRVVRERMFDQDGTPLPEVVYGWDDIQTLAAP